ncbi:Beta-galactosidase BgaA [compost metagenome]
MRAFPGAAKELCGITVEEFTMVKGNRAPTSIKWSHSDAVTGADAFNDILHVEADTVEVVGTYATDYYTGKPAVTVNRRGTGEVWYYGAVFNEAAAQQVISLLGLSSPAAEWLELPEEVELLIRSSENESLAFLLNYSESPVDILLKAPKSDLLTGRQLSGKHTLEGFGVLVLH